MSARYFSKKKNKKSKSKAKKQKANRAVRALESKWDGSTFRLITQPLIY